jgi:hypothetical protein
MPEPEHLTLDGGQLLLASEDERLVSARLVPFNEPCSSNLGRFTVGAGVLQLPADPAPAILNDGHRREAPLGVGVVYAEHADGIHASWRVAKSPAGDAALADIKAGRRKAVSVEAEVMVVDGRAVSGHVFAAALVGADQRPAFPSAVLLATAADNAVANPDDPTTAHYTTKNVDPATGDVYETETTVEETEETDPDTGAQVVTRTTTDITTVTPGTPGEGQAPVTDPTAPAAPLLASVPDTLLSPRGRGARAGRQAAASGLSFQQLLATLAASGSDERARQLLGSKAVKGTLFAALTDVPYDGAGATGDVVQQPQYLGELWSGVEYVRKYTPLFGSGQLTSMTLTGFRWTTRPEMDDWAGNKAEVPSGPGPEAEPYSTRAKRLAGAHDIAREYRDFNVTAFWDAYFRAMTESYVRLSDEYAIAQALGSVTVTIDDTPTVIKNYTDVTADTVPSGVSAAASKIVDGALAIVDVATPQWAIVGKADYRELLLTRSQDTLEYLNMALGLKEGTVNPDNFKLIPSAHPKFADGHVAVGAPTAGKFYELSGVPIRTEGLDMVHGGIDPGLFGYVGYVGNNPEALAYVAPGA